MAIIKATAQGDLAWRVLSLLNLYRLLVPIVLASLHFAAPDTGGIGWFHPKLFLSTVALYFATGIVMISALKMRWPVLSQQAWVHLVVDIVAITLVLYSSGGVSSGLGLLLIVPVGAVSLLLPSRAAFMAAAGAALALLAQQVAVQLTGVAGGAEYTAAGVLGVVLFMVTLGAWPVADRLRESEALVRQREVDLANLAELSQYIVQHLRESILVVDAEDRIRLINEIGGADPGRSRGPIPGALLGEVSAAPPLPARDLASTDPHGATPLPGSFLAVDGARGDPAALRAARQHEPGPGADLSRGHEPASPSACSSPSSQRSGV